MSLPGFDYLKTYQCNITYVCITTEIFEHKRLSKQTHPPVINIAQPKEESLFQKTLPFFPLAPSLPPEDREVYNVTSTSCEIRWGPIPDEHQNGIIIGYELQYAPYSRDTLEIILDKLQNVSLSANTSSYRLTGLDSYRQYSISIVGETSAGKGAHSGPESRSLCTTEADCK